MQETVTNTNERKSLFSSFLEVLEAREKQAQSDRQLQEEKYQRRTQRIYDFHDRQQREAVELRRCLDYVSQHAHVLESVLRGAGGGGAGDGVPLSAALVRQAAALQRCMAQCVANAARIRALLTAAHQPQMDTMLAKMEAELSTWTAFLQRAVDATYNTEVVIDNLHNMIGNMHPILKLYHIYRRLDVYVRKEFRTYIIRPEIGCVCHYKYVAAPTDYNKWTKTSSNQNITVLQCQSATYCL
ncbi:uncharacterized protein [Epargyreus clarus]|uniref:uncharacterized protein isoform X1 n=1 Tax=Epargyreus clarus TaxID=520877 RepID=UPI003C2C68AC